MLLKYKINNFCSFKGNAIFSMKPRKAIERFEDNFVQIDSRLKILKVAVIVGENAGGKTNFIRSLQYLKYLFNSNDDIIHTINHLSFGYEPQKIQSFEVSVLCENKKIYTYELETDKHNIVSEILYVRNQNQSEKNNKEVFNITRIMCEYEKDEKDENYDREKRLKSVYNINLEVKLVGSDFRKIIETKIDSEHNAIKGLFVNYLSNIGVEIVEEFVNWVKKRLIVEIPDEASLNIYKQLKKEEEDIKIMKKDSYFEIFSLVDSSIIDIQLNEEEPYEKTTIIRENSNGNKFEIQLKNESSGVKEFFAWSVQLWKVIHTNAVLLADEIDRVLNPILSSRIVNYIQGSEHCGQFIFTTHNAFHLNTNDYMKEQLYFATKEKETFESEMYSLADFKDYRYEKSDVYDLYLKGILGGVPND